MASIKAKLSSIELYEIQSRDEYNLILNLANDILSRTERMYIWVQEELEKINRQVMRVNMAHDTISDKVDSYIASMEDARDDIDSYTDEIDYIRNHPTTITTTDDEGNESTQEVVDYAAIRVAERARDAARDTYDLYSNKLDEARIVHREASYLVNRFENIKRGIETVSRSIQNDIYEIKKFIKAIEDESEFNINSLQGVINSLQYYLSSISIFMPDGSYYEEFASAKVGNKSFSSSKTNSIEDEKDSTIERKDESCFIDRNSITNNISNWEEKNRAVLVCAINEYLADLGQAEASQEELEQVAQIIPNIINNGAMLVHQDHARDNFEKIIEGKYKTKTDVFRDTKKEASGGGSYSIKQRIDGSKKLFGHELDDHAGSEISCCLVDSVDFIPILVENYTGNYGSIVSVFEWNKVKDSLVYCGGDSMDDLVTCNTYSEKINALYNSKNYHGVVGVVDNPTLGALPYDAAAKLIVAMRSGERIDSVKKYIQVTGKYIEGMLTKEVGFKEHVSEVVLCPKKAIQKEKLLSYDIINKIREQKNVQWVNSQGILEKL